MVRFLRHTRAHEYPHLIRRWRQVARATGLILSPYAASGGWDLFYLEPRRPRPDAPSIYLSAGIHGDEAGATDGLLEWATMNPDLLKTLNLLIFPCLNPWGLVNNCRMDAEGRDLNRGFHNRTIPQIDAQLRVMAERRFDLALTLHEDYDALGMYIYEVPGRPGHWAETLLQAAARHVPTDTRKKIEGSSARAGVVRRAIKPHLMPNWPEAFVLHFHHAARTFTIETPSEFFLDDRVAAHMAVVTKAVVLCRKEAAQPRSKSKKP